MKEKYIYFISFSYINGINTGFGSGIYTLNKKFDSAESYDDVTNFIKEENKLDNVVILYFKELKEEK